VPPHIPDRYVRQGGTGAVVIVAVDVAVDVDVSSSSCLRRSH